MRISIFGMGYVGCVTGACFADMGNTVLGVEPNPVKVDLINSGKSPIIEKDLDTLLAKVVSNGSFRATADWAQAIKDSDIALVCVGTPSRTNGSIDLRFVQRVCEQIGAALAQHPGRLTVVIRSTVMPGTMDSLVIPTLEKASGKKAGKDFGLCMHPEFLREGTSIHDFYNPPKTVIGELDKASGETLASLYVKTPGPMIRTSLRVAEMVKYADNCFHGLKVAFANEIGNICREASIDSHQVMEIFCQDTKLNLSPYYMKPGFAFGGSCLPKDLRATLYMSKMRDVELPMHAGIVQSNRVHIDHAITKILARGKRRVGMIGLSFKTGTDDLRESPLVIIAEHFIGKGLALQVYDPEVHLSRLLGANLRFIEKHVPHLGSLLRSDIEEVIAESDLLVVGLGDARVFEALEQHVRPDQMVLDLVNIPRRAALRCECVGLCW